MLVSSDGATRVQNTQATENHQQENQAAAKQGQVAGIAVKQATPPKESPKSTAKPNDTTRSAQLKATNTSTGSEKSGTVEGSASVNKSLTSDGKSTTKNVNTPFGKATITATQHNANLPDIIAGSKYNETGGATLSLANSNTSIGNALKNVNNALSPLNINKTLNGPAGSLQIQGNTSLDAKVNGSVDTSQLSKGEISANVSAQAGLSANYSASYNSPTVNIAGQKVGVSAQGNVNGFVGAEGNASADVNLFGAGGPHINVGGSAFAGARVDASATGALTVNGQSVASGTATASAYAGVGVEGEAQIGIKNGNLNFDLGFGAALGAGAGFNVSGSINLDAAKQAVENVEHTVAKDASSVANKVTSDISHAASSVGNFFKSIF
jgi:hypothetical protein